jgi:plasmid maintenance system antidote protein VapI
MTKIEVIEIKKALIDSDMTLTDLAKLLGMTRQNLHRILSGKTKRALHEQRIFESLGLKENGTVHNRENQESCHPQ